MDQGVRSSPMLSRVDKRSVCNDWRLRNDMSSIARELTSLVTVRAESTDKRARLRIFDLTLGVPFLLFLMTVVAFVVVEKAAHRCETKALATPRDQYCTFRSESQHWYWAIHYQTLV